MRAIPFNEPGEYKFHFRGMRDGRMSLLLYAGGKSDANREEPTDLHTSLEALLVDQHGNIICRASATPGTGPDDRRRMFSRAAAWTEELRAKPATSAKSETGI
jgi:hypothetical protein